VYALPRSSPHSLSLFSPLSLQGLADINRTVISVKEDTKPGAPKELELLSEGRNLLGVLGNPASTGPAPHATTSSRSATAPLSVFCSLPPLSLSPSLEVSRRLGIEAGRTTIIDQIQYTMKLHGLAVDPHHTVLLADLMTSTGEILGITRFGIGKMKDSVLMLASFERTLDHIFDVAMRGSVDEISGVSECIILGKNVPLGTGSLGRVGCVCTAPPFPTLPLSLFSPLCLQDRADINRTVISVKEDTTTGAPKELELLSEETNQLGVRNRLFRCAERFRQPVLERNFRFGLSFSLRVPCPRIPPPSSSILSTFAFTQRPSPFFSSPLLPASSPASVSLSPR
jgi:hypothetical protein